MPGLNKSATQLQKIVRGRQGRKQVAEIKYKNEISKEFDENMARTRNQEKQNHDDLHEIFTKDHKAKKLQAVAKRAIQKNTINDLKFEKELNNLEQGINSTKETVKQAVIKASKIAKSKTQEKATKTLQAAIKRNSESTFYSKFKNAYDTNLKHELDTSAITLQNTLRNHQAKKEFRNTILNKSSNEKQAATTLQNAYKSHLARKEYDTELKHELDKTARRAKTRENTANLEAQMQAQYNKFLQGIEISNKPPRASMSSVNSAASTEVGTRELVRADDPNYRRGQYHRGKDETKGKTRPLVEVLRQDSLYNQGYYGDALQQNLEGYVSRVVKKGPKKK